MSWKDRLQPGSFKGVPFATEGHEAEFLRNVVSKSYLNSNDVTSRDVGRKADKYKFDIFFLGDDYMDQRDAFLALRSSPDPGTLIHPYLGSIEVNFTGAVLRESSREGRIARVSVSFVEAGTKKFPEISDDRRFKLNASVDVVQDVAAADFVQKARLSQVSDFVRGGVTTVTNPVFTSMRDLIDTGVLATNLDTNIINSSDYIFNFAQLRANLNQLIDPVPSIIGSSSIFSTLVRSTFGLIFSTGQNGSSARAVSKLARNAEVSLETETTQQIEYKNDNQEAVERFIEVTGVAAEAQSIQNITFESRSEALDVRNDIATRIDTLAETSVNDDEYQALKNLKSEVILYLPPEDLELPRVRSISLPSTLSSLLVAYDVYGDIEKESDIISRNGIRHPAFINPSNEIEVLVDG